MIKFLIIAYFIGAISTILYVLKHDAKQNDSDLTMTFVYDAPSYTEIGVFWILSIVVIAYLRRRYKKVKRD